MKTKIKNMVKNNKIIYSIYYYVMFVFIRILSLFCKTNKNQILFVVYGGKRYDDSPRFIYEYIKSNEKYKKMICKWAFIEPEKFSFIPESEKVKIDTIKYYITVLKSKYWFTNSSIQRGLNFRKRNSKNIFFTHGIAALKKFGKDLDNKSKSFKIKKKEEFDMIFIQGKEEKEIWVKAAEMDGEKFYLTGLPRNDELYSATSKRIEELKEKLKIPKNKKVILYAPTFREFYLDDKLNNIIKSPFDFEKWERELGNEYVFLFTAHYQIGKLLNIPQNSNFVINAFEYPYINDLLLVSDILISDYSSVFFDYSILERPMFCYAFDYDKYKENRGFYADPNDVFSGGAITEEEKLLDKIKNIDYKKECEYTKNNIKDKFIFDSKGKATQEVVNIIFKDKRGMIND